MKIDTEKITPDCDLMIAMVELLSKCGCKHKSNCLADSCSECLCSYYNGFYDHLLIPLVVEKNTEVINAEELTEELEKQREIKEDCEYSKGINAMLDTALMIIHNFTLGDEIAEKGKKTNEQ